MTKRLLALAMALFLVPAMAVFGQTASDSGKSTTTKSKRHHKRKHIAKKRGVGGEYKKGGSDVGKGSKKLAHNIKHGRVVEGGKEFGKGVGHGAKHIAKGTAKGTKKVVDPNASKKPKN